MSLMISTERLDCGAKTTDEAKRQLVLASRIFANEGIMDGLGHVSIRNPENPNTFFQPRSISPEFVCLDDIMEIDLNGDVIQGIEGKSPLGERILHGRILAHRPDVNCVYHGHPLPIIPFTVCKNMPLEPVYIYGAIFHNGFAYYNDFDVSSGTLVVTPEEGERFARALGDKWACLMRGHGLATCADNIPMLVLDTVQLVKNAVIQLNCVQIGGKPKLCTEEEGRAHRQIAHGNNVLVRMWNYYVERAKKAMPDVADFNHI